MTLQDLIFFSYIFGIPLVGLIFGALIGFKKKKYLGLIIGIILGSIIAVLIQIILAMLFGGSGGFSRVLS